MAGTKRPRDSDQEEPKKRHRVNPTGDIPTVSTSDTVVEKSAAKKPRKPRQRKAATVDTRDSDQYIAPTQNVSPLAETEEMAARHPSQRRYSGDVEELPEYPEEDWDYYPKIENGNWQCGHKSFDCAIGVCETHDCCKNGHKTPAAMIRKSIETWRNRVTRMIQRRALDRRHDTWSANRKTRAKKSEEGKPEPKVIETEPEQIPKEPQEINTVPGSEPDMPAAAQQFPVEQETSAEARATDTRETRDRIKKAVRRVKRLRRQVKNNFQTRQGVDQQDWEHFDAWWDTAEKEAREQPLSQAEKELRQRPEWSSLTVNQRRTRKQIALGQAAQGQSDSFHSRAATTETELTASLSDDQPTIDLAHKQVHGLEAPNLEASKDDDHDSLFEADDEDDEDSDDPFEDDGEEAVFSQNFEDGQGVVFGGQFSASSAEESGDKREPGRSGGSRQQASEGDGQDGLEMEDIVAGLLEDGSSSDDSDHENRQGSSRSVTGVRAQRNETDTSDDSTTTTEDNVEGDPELDDSELDGYILNLAEVQNDSDTESEVAKCKTNSSQRPYCH